MENININDFLHQVDIALLWLTEGTLYKKMNVGVENEISIDRDEKQTTIDVLEKLIQEAPDEAIRDWLQCQLDKKFGVISDHDADLSDIETFESVLKKPVPRPETNWIEELERESTHAMQEAEEIVNKKSLKAYLCPAIQTLSDDVFEIAKVTTPILIGLVAGGILSLSLFPLLFAAIALVITRAGIASFCSDF